MTSPPADDIMQRVACFRETVRAREGGGGRERNVAFTTWKKIFLCIRRKYVLQTEQKYI